MKSEGKPEVVICKRSNPWRSNPTVPLSNVSLPSPYLISLTSCRSLCLANERIPLWACVVPKQSTRCSIYAVLIFTSFVVTRLVVYPVSTCRAFLFSVESPNVYAFLNNVIQANPKKWKICPVLRKPVFSAFEAAPVFLAPECPKSRVFISALTTGILVRHFFFVKPPILLVAQNGIWESKREGADQLKKDERC